MGSRLLLKLAEQSYQSPGGNPGPVGHPAVEQAGTHVVERNRDPADETADRRANKCASYCASPTAEEIKKDPRDFHSDREKDTLIRKRSVSAFRNSSTNRTSR